MSKAIEITGHDYTAFELRGIAAQSDDGAVVRRLLAVAFVLDGQSRAEAAQACRRIVNEPTRPRRGGFNRGEKPNPGAGPHAARAAAQTRQMRHDDP